MKLNNNDDSHNSGLNLLIYNMLLDIESRHTLRGCVDWNNYSQLYFLEPRVTPCVGVWIETDVKNLKKADIYVTPCVGVWIETPCGLWFPLPA